MARRGENIYKRKDGRWEGRIRVKNPDGQYKFRYLYAHSYAEIKQKMRDFDPNAQISKEVDKNVNYYADQWLKTVKLRRKHSSYMKYSNICKNHILPALGKIRVCALRNEDIYNLIASMEDLAPKTKNDILCVIKMIYSYAESAGCKGNVQLNQIGVRVPKSNAQVLDIDEQQRLVSYLSAGLDDFVKLGIYLVIHTGIRIGELCALRRGDIDLDKKVLHIGATMQRIQTGNASKKTEIIITDPKSRCSVRDIPLTANLTKTIESHIREMPEKAFLLTGDCEKIIEPNTVRYHFTKFLQLCGVQKIKFHGLRHTFATRCVESGMDVKTLSEILGHENVNITLERYVHPSVELKRQSMEKLDCSAAYKPLDTSPMSA